MRREKQESTKADAQKCTTATTHFEGSMGLVLRLGGHSLCRPM